MNNKDSNSSFWISYADLMAGLLFIFILLIGAIIVKYTLLQSESKVLELTLEKEKVALEKNKKQLKEEKAKIKNALNELQTTKEKLKARLLENEKLKYKSNENQNEIERLSILQEQMNDKLKEMEKQKDEKIDSLFEELLLKQRLVKSMSEQTQSLDDEIKVLEVRLDESLEKHTNLVEDLQKTKQKIKNFTGIKIKVISILKDKLGDKIQIDPKNGSLRLSSNILFDEGRYELKNSSKVALKNAVYDYFFTILENEEINKHIDKIVIEGHTNSKGNFLYNLELSQKRAYSVMDFLLSLDFEKKQKLRNLIVASGRSYLDPIYKNGIEDKEASRRIEIKFSLKNEQAIKEIANLLK